MRPACAADTQQLRQESNMNQPEPPESDQPDRDASKRQPDAAPITRRRFMHDGALYAAGLGVFGAGLAGCGGAGTEPEGTFGHGVASGDPLADRVILWTRVTPKRRRVGRGRLGGGARRALRQLSWPRALHRRARRATTPSRSTLPACSRLPPTTTVFGIWTSCHRSGAPRPCRRVRLARCGLR